MVGYPAGNSLLASAAVTGPAAGAAIATIAAANLPAGTYHIFAAVSYGTVAGVLNDMQLKAGVTVLYTWFIAASVSVNGTINLECVRQLDGATALSVNAIAGVAGGIYQASIIATPIRGA